MRELTEIDREATERARAEYRAASARLLEEYRRTGDTCYLDDLNRIGAGNAYRYRTVYVPEESDVPTARTVRRGWLRRLLGL